MLNCSGHEVLLNQANMVPYIFRDVLMTFLACAGTISASPQRRADYALKEKHFVPRSWTRVGPAPSQHKLQLHIGVKQGNFNELERHLYEGNSKHPNQSHDYVLVCYDQMLTSDSF